ncbi:septation protein SepH [Nocardiopsis alba]|uniref:septation protein SepH n=1 Tax=Nocardiopsis alba TaxID=53437 RepID=UPI00363A2BD1
MHELRLVAVSEDGTYLVLASPGRGTRFTLPVDDRLRAAVRGQFSRLGQYEIEVENPLRPKEIQARIRSGETAEAISEISGIPIERVRWFEGPVLQEREYIAQQAQRATVRTPGDATPGPSLEEIVTKRIGAHQLETGDAVWDSWKREDRTWQLKLVFLHGGEERVAHWLYEPRHRSVTPADEEAARFSSPEPPVVSPEPGANVTPFAPRRSEAPTDLPRLDAQSTAERRNEHVAPRRLSSAQDTPLDDPLRSAMPRGEQPGAPAREETRRPAERRPERAPDRGPSPQETPPAAPLPGNVSSEPVRRRPAPPVERRPHPEPWQEPQTAPEPAPRPVSGFEDPFERPAPRHRPDPPPAAPERPAARAVVEPEPEPAPPRAPAPEPQRPRRRRATIDLDDQGTPRRAAEQQQPAAPPVPAAADGTSGGAAGAARRKGRGRRASVPSWDEIMFGSKKNE